MDAPLWCSRCGGGPIEWIGTTAAGHWYLCRRCRHVWPKPNAPADR